MFRETPIYISVAYLPSGAIVNSSEWVDKLMEYVLVGVAAVACSAGKSHPMHGSRTECCSHAHNLQDLQPCSANFHTIKLSNLFVVYEAHACPCQTTYVVLEGVGQCSLYTCETCEICTHRPGQQSKPNFKGIQRKP